MTSSEREIRVWLEKYDQPCSLPMREAVRALNDAPPGADVGAVLAAALAVAKERDAQRDAYVSRIALEWQSVRAAMKWPTDSEKQASTRASDPVFAREWSLERWFYGKEAAAPRVVRADDAPSPLVAPEPTRRERDRPRVAVE